MAVENWTPEDLKKNLDAGKNVFLKLWKEGCGACKLSEPAITRLADANEYNLEFGQILATDHPEILELAESEVLPTFLVFKDRKLAGKLIGFKGIAKLQELLTSTFSKS